MMNIIYIRPNGPLIARGDIYLHDQDGELIQHADEVFLCRCGASQNKPFCDGAHKHCHFQAGAEIQDDKAETAAGDGPLTISVRSNAMLIVKGPMTVSDEAHTQQTTRNKAALCRCGHSQKKPFCDVSHKQCGFEDN